VDSVTSGALDWSFAHIKKYGDTDVFPVPFEFQAVGHGWNAIRPHLEQRDLGQYVTAPGQRLLVPKPGGGFRIALQLDPLDALIYTAMVYEGATTIEQHRASADLKVACSYRVSPDATGNLFASEGGWLDFHTRSGELANSGAYSHVLLADISDFYNQVGHHRVENALEFATISVDRAKNIERFLTRLSAKQTRGLPVGPSASIILAEICLNDVDMFLMRKGCPHVRYVDDFHVFCRSRKEAVALRHDLTEYLYTAHRLSLEAYYKTKVVSVESFLEKELRDPEEDERRAKTSKLRELLDFIRDSTGYHVSLDDLSDDDRSRAVRESLRELFDECVAEHPLHLGLARHLLRQATASRTAELIPRVFDRLEVLAPVFREVARYIIRALPTSQARLRGAELADFLLESDVGGLGYVRAWGLEVFVQCPDMIGADVAMDLASQSRPMLGGRPMALIARSFRQLDWVREQKETWQNHGSWDRRAVIWASGVLPKGERRHWLSVVEEGTDLLDRVVAQLSAAQQ
jgi:hypothetical protein